VNDASTDRRAVRLIGLFTGTERHRTVRTHQVTCAGVLLTAETWVAKSGHMSKGCSNAIQAADYTPAPQPSMSLEGPAPAPAQPRKDVDLSGHARGADHTCRMRYAAAKLPG
jgi:hypothetical protein